MRTTFSMNFFNITFDSKMRISIGISFETWWSSLESGFRSQLISNSQFCCHMSFVTLQLAKIGGSTAKNGGVHRMTQDI